jgi:hypothetical protein
MPMPPRPGGGHIVTTQSVAGPRLSGMSGSRSADSRQSIFGNTVVCGNLLCVAFPLRKGQKTIVKRECSSVVGHAVHADRPVHHRRDGHRRVPDHVRRPASRARPHANPVRCAETMALPPPAAHAYRPCGRPRRSAAAPRRSTPSPGRQTAGKPSAACDARASSSAGSCRVPRCDGHAPPPHRQPSSSRARAWP